MIYRSVQLIQIFLAHGSTGGWITVVQEVLADLKMVKNTKSVLRIIESFSVSDFSQADLKTVLKIQKLAHEYKKDAD